MRKPYSCPVPTSEARLRLAAHLSHVKKLQVAHDDVVAQWRRLQAIKKDEAMWQARLDAVKARDARELAAELVNPKGVLINANHQAIGEVEWELNRAKREADVARACEPDVDARQAAASETLDQAQRRTLPLAAVVLVEEAQTLASEIAEDTARLRAKHARIHGLRRFLADSPADLVRLVAGVPALPHPDTALPDNPEINREASSWREYADRLRADASATRKE